MTWSGGACSGRTKERAQTRSSVVGSRASGSASSLTTMTPPLPCVALHTYVRGRALQSMVRGSSAIAYASREDVFAHLLADVLARRALSAVIERYGRRSNSILRRT